jgi:hypothetical protein
MNKIKTVTEKWQMIDFATKHGARVTNEKGEKVVTADNYDDAVKCYTSFPYYYLSAAENHDLLFDGKPYDQWHSEKVFDVE